MSQDVCGHLLEAGYLPHIPFAPIMNILCAELESELTQEERLDSVTVTRGKHGPSVKVCEGHGPGRSVLEKILRSGVSWSIAVPLSARRDRHAHR